MEPTSNRTNPLYAIVAVLLVLISSASGFIHLCNFGIKPVEFVTPFLIAFMSAYSFLKARTIKRAIAIALIFCIAGFLLGEIYTYFVHEYRVGAS